MAADLKSLNEVIRERLHSEVALIQTVAEYIIAAGGKRLRPVILCLVSRALRRDAPPDRHALLAAVVEFIHTATLLHDDVVDESDLRRGRQTANAVFGNAASVLVGDFLYSRSFQMMVEPGLMRVMQVLADATNTIAEGEVLQLLNIRDPDVDQARYLKVIRYKTARLFEASAQLAAILSQAPAGVELACAEFGGRLGTAFQLIDDVLDYEGHAEQTGKNLGDDLREGKPTLPLIYLLQHGTLAQRDLVRKAIESGGVDQDHVDFFNIVDAVQSSGALAFTRQQAELEASAARQAISLLPAGEAQLALLALTEYATERSH
ncbi:MAG: polyprenyl synthetase family protein [Burkholderiaceae bacterium]